MISHPTDRRIAARGEELAIAQPCFPVQAAYGHVQALLESGTTCCFPSVEAISTISDTESVELISGDFAIAKL